MVHQNRFIFLLKNSLVCEPVWFGSVELFFFLPNPRSVHCVSVVVVAVGGRVVAWWWWRLEEGWCRGSGGGGWWKGGVVVMVAGGKVVSW